MPDIPFERHQPPDPPPGSPGKKEIDPVEMALHELPYGIYVIGSTAEGRPNAMIADWVMQVSFRPRLLAVGFERDSRSLARIRAGGAFTVNLLPGGQDGLELARNFVQPADPSKVRGRSDPAASAVDKLAGVEHALTASGCPVLQDCLAWLECAAEQFLDVGDHVLVVGRVVDGDVPGDGEPLTSRMVGWTYSG